MGRKICDSTMRYRNGLELHPDDVALVQRIFVHRFTMDHKPQWANQLRPDGTPYAVQFASDFDWLCHTEFQVDRNGRLRRDSREGCISSPTWPLNPELRRKWREREVEHA